MEKPNANSSYTKKLIYYSLNEFQTKQIRHSVGKNCLTLQDESDVVRIEPCDSNQSRQKWHLGPLSSHEYTFEIEIA